MSPEIAQESEVSVSSPVHSTVGNKQCHRKGPGGRALRMVSSVSVWALRGIMCQWGSQSLWAQGQ